MSEIKGCEAVCVQIQIYLTLKNLKWEYNS